MRPVSIYDVLRKAESERTERTTRSGEADMSETGAVGALNGELTNLHALVKDVARKLDSELSALRREQSENVASLEVSLGAMEDRIEDELFVRDDASAAQRFEALGARIDRAEATATAAVDGSHATGEAVARLESGQSRLARAIEATEQRVGQEVPRLRDELDELIEKRTQATVSEFVVRDQATRERLESRIDALRVDLDRSLRRQGMLLGTLVVAALFAYTC